MNLATDHATTERQQFIADIASEQDQFEALKGSGLYQTYLNIKALVDFAPLGKLEKHRPRIGRPVMASRRWPARSGKPTKQGVQHAITD